MKHFFTSDTHFGHSRIIEYCDRPFASVQQMDEEMIFRWNSRVDESDVVYHLGDFSFGCDLEHSVRCLDRLNGDIRFVEGNHDKHLKAIRQQKLGRRKGLNSLTQYEEVAVDGQKLVLFHYGMRTWHHSLRGVWHLYGHSHNQLPPLGKSVDVGVDRWDFAPVSMGQLRSFLDKQPLHKEDPAFACYTPAPEPVL